MISHGRRQEKGCTASVMPRKAARGRARPLLDSTGAGAGAVNTRNSACISLSSKTSTVDMALSGERTVKDSASKRIIPLLFSGGKEKKKVAHSPQTELVGTGGMKDPEAVTVQDTGEDGSMVIQSNTGHAKPVPSEPPSVNSMMEGAIGEINHHTSVSSTPIYEGTVRAKIVHTLTVENNENIETSEPGIKRDLPSIKSPLKETDSGDYFYSVGSLGLLQRWSRTKLKKSSWIAWGRWHRPQ